MTSFLSNRSIYESVICGIVPQAKERLWIAIAYIKDLRGDESMCWLACRGMRMGVVII